MFSLFVCFNMSIKKEADRFVLWPLHFLAIRMPKFETFTFFCVWNEIISLLHQDHLDSIVGPSQNNAWGFLPFSMNFKGCSHDLWHDDNPI